MSKPILYGAEVSPPVRTVLLTAKALGLDLEYRPVDVLAGEHKSEEYLKKNPQHTIPLLEDDGKCIWDSHAIAAYLVSKYGKDDALYPKDLYQRAVVDQRLHFDTGVLFTTCLKGVFGHILKGEPLSEEVITKCEETYDFMEKFLDQSFLAGEHLTIADLSCVATLSSFENAVPIDGDRFPKLSDWYGKIQALTYYAEIHNRGLAMREVFLNKLLKKE